MKKFLNTKKLVTILGFLGLYLISAGISWAAFSFISGGGESAVKTNGGGGLSSERSKIASLPKTEECPINGDKLTKIEREIWEKRRPLTAVIENHADARPQSGLSKADVVYEAVAEGGITRFLGVFYCAAAGADLKIAPVRSARIYFINWAAEYGKDPIFLHVGGANNIDNSSPSKVKFKGQVAPEVDAFAALEKLGWRRGGSGNDFDGGTNVGVPVVERDQYRLGGNEPAAWEHSVVAYVDEAYEEAEKRDFGVKGEDGERWDEAYIPWLFTDGSPAGSPSAREISFEFWSNKPEYDVKWVYDSTTNSYKRFNGGQVFTDLEFNKEQVAAKNIVIQFVKEKGPVDKELHMFYQNIGSGEALVFQNGNVIKGTWKKATILERTKFYNEGGAEIKFVRGPIWIEALPDGNNVVY